MFLQSTIFVFFENSINPRINMPTEEQRRNRDTLIAKLKQMKMCSARRQHPTRSTHPSHLHGESRQMHRMRESQLRETGLPMVNNHATGSYATSRGSIPAYLYKGDADEYRESRLRASLRKPLQRGRVCAFEEGFTTDY